MLRFHTALMTTLAVATAAVALSGCAGGPTRSTTVTRPRLERSIEKSFANRYVQLSKTLGHSDVTVRSMDAHAVCDKGGASVPDEGPGGDWLCWVSYEDSHVPNPDGSIKIEMNVHANDCYSGIGSAKLVGPLNIVDQDGRPAINPVSEFDACFDPSTSDTPDGTIMIVNPILPPGAAPLAKSALTLPVGLVKPASDGRIPLALACAAGTARCTGTISATLQDKDIGSASYNVPAGGTATEHLALTPTQVREGGMINLTADETSPRPAAS